jgi:hypothetical protein
MNNNYVSNEMFAGRLSAHGQITDLSEGFKIDAALPFSICVVPKAATTDVLLLVDLKLWMDAGSSDFPVPLNDWTPGAIMEIAPEAIELADYDVYWACGQTVNI